MKEDAMLKTMLQGMRDMAQTGLNDRKSFLGLWYREWADLFLQAFEPGRKVVYTSIYAFPMEILASFDVVPFDFEIAGSLLAIANLGTPLMTTAEERGYSQDICSFHRASLGACFTSCLPAPDLLLTTSFYCDGKAKTNDILARLWGRESFLLDTPHVITKESVGYVERQLKEAARRIGAVSGRRLDEDRLKEAVKSSNRSRRLQLEILETMKSRPVAVKGYDFIAYSINGQLFSGRPTREMLDAQLLEDMRQRLGSGRLKPERHRLSWFAWIPVYQSTLFDLLKEHQVSVAACETSRVYWDEIDEDHPFEGLALKCLKNPFVGPTSRRLEGLRETVRDHGIDGALLFATPACRVSKSAHMLLKEAFSNLGVPFLTLDMDIADQRGYLPEGIRTRLEGFIEVLDSAGPPSGPCHEL
jgi:benzoyl-CoA reductase/2-hydroxyglutaryl-CoA dehydratase subunit BcrC/BadD/HgdB